MRKVAVLFALIAAAGPEVHAAAGRLCTQLWPDHRVRYLIDPGVSFQRQTAKPLCALHSTQSCEMPLRQGIILAGDSYEEQTTLLFENETVSGDAPAVAPDPKVFLRHDHPHLWFVEGFGGHTYSFSSLRSAYFDWRSRCSNPGPDQSCNSISKDPMDPSNSSMNPTDAEKVAWKYAGNDQTFLRPGCCSTVSYTWPLTGSLPALAHDDSLITIPKRNLITPGPLDQHYDEGALHEIGHALGMEHEQRREDRDQAVWFFSCNVEEGGDQAFKVLPMIELSPYDIGSIMQYDSKSKCRNGSTTSSACATDAAGQPLYPLLAKKSVPGFTTGGALTYAKCPPETGTVSGYSISRPGTLTPEDVNVLYQLYPDVRKWSNESGDRFGAAAASADFDGDGYDDLAVGAPGEVNALGAQAGSVYVYKGTYSGLVPWRILNMSVADGSGDFGAALAAGDLNGDGRAELVVGAPAASVNGLRTGAAWILDGTAAGLEDNALATKLATFGSTASLWDARFGAALTIGNLDGSGAPEIAVGAPGRESVYLFRGDGAAYRVLAPTGSVVPIGQRFGAALAVGRLTSSGPLASLVTDLLIGAPGGPGSSTDGALYVSRGGSTPGTPVRIAQPDSGHAAGDGFGMSIVTGHFSTGSTTEVAVGAPGYNHRRGRLYLMSIAFPGPGVATATLRQILRRNDLGLTSVADAMFGRSLAVVPAVPRLFGFTPANDLAVGIPATPGGSAGAGMVGFFSGSSTATPQLTGLAATLSQPAYHGGVGGSQEFGLALAAGNFDRKAGVDLAVGVPGKGAGTGAVWVASSGSPPTFAASDAAALRFATFLDQGHIYNHWSGTAMVTYPTWTGACPPTQIVCPTD